MITITGMGNSYVCVFAQRGDAYIDARKTHKGCDHTKIELVRDGMVRQYISCSNEQAPGLIIELMRNKFRPLSRYDVSDYQLALETKMLGIKKPLRTVMGEPSKY